MSARMWARRQVSGIVCDCGFCDGCFYFAMGEWRCGTASIRVFLYPFVGECLS